MNKKKELIGRDELNLIEVPFTVLSTRATNIKKLEFEDKQNDIIRHWTVKGSEEFGFPCAADEEIYIAMICLTQRNNFRNRKVPFNQYEILNLMKWRTDGAQYKRLELALCRLVEMTIYTDYLWDKGEFKKHISKVGFHIIDKFYLDRGTKKSRNSYFTWSDTIFDSLSSGNLKSLDIDTYFNLKTATSKRFYRVWDKRAYKKNQITFDLFNLCHEKLGISRMIKTAPLLKQALESALKEHKEKKLLSLAEYRKKKNKKWVLTIKKYDKEITKPIADDKLEENPLISKLLSLKIPHKKAIELIKNHNDVSAWLDALDVLKPQNRAGFLISALTKGWTIPEELKKRKVKKQKTKKEELKQEYYKSIFAEVDRKLNLDSAQLAREVEKHKPIFLQKFPYYKQFENNIFLNPLLEQDYKKIKAEELGLISFEEWERTEKIR